MLRHDRQSAPRRFDHRLQYRTRHADIDITYVVHRVAECNDNITGEGLKFRFPTFHCSERLVWYEQRRSGIQEEPGALDLQVIFAPP